MKDPHTSILTVPRLEPISWLVHGFGTGSWHEEDFAAAPAFAGFTPVIMRQIHSAIVHRLEAVPERKLEGDALITNVPGLLLVVRTADCLPVLLIDEAHRAVGSVHCGWRGTRGRILERAIEAMRGAYGTDPASLLAALGPCIGPCCYEVGPEVRASFAEAGFPDAIFQARASGESAESLRGRTGRSKNRSSVPARDGENRASGAGGQKNDESAQKPENPGTPSGRSSQDRAFLDLRAANAWLLESTGVPRAHISGPEACTFCEPTLLSYRRHAGEKRRMYNFIGIRPL